MPANMVFRRKICGARDNAIPPRSTPALNKNSQRASITYYNKNSACMRRNNKQNACVDIYRGI